MEIQSKMNEKTNTKMGVYVFIALLAANLMFKMSEKINEVTVTTKGDTIFIPADTKFKFMKFGNTPYQLSKPELVPLDDMAHK